jgi:hypothetical protein
VHLGEFQRHVSSLSTDGGNEKLGERNVQGRALYPIQLSWLLSLLA